MMAGKSLRNALLGVCSAAGATLAAAPPAAEMAGRTVVMEVVRASGRTPAPWPPGDFRLGVELLPAGDEFNLYRAVAQRGIAPDSEALTLVADLNPEVKDLEGLKQGSSLRVPVIEGEAERASLRAAGCVVQLSVDPELRKELNAAARAVRDAAAAFAALPAGRFADASARAQTQEQVALLAKWFSEIENSYAQRRGPPLRRQSLLQLRDEARALRGILEAARAGSNIEAADREQVAALHEDVQIEIRKYGQELGATGPKPDPLFKVTVNLISDAPDVIRKLRVYYTVNGLYRDGKPPADCSWFAGLGSGKSEKLPAKNYRIWAARDGEPQKPLTAAVLVPVPGADDPVSVDLEVVDGIQ